MTGKPSLDKILIGINFVLVLGAAAFIAFSHTSHKKEATNLDAEIAALEKSATDQLNLKPFKLGKVTVNLYSRKTRLRFLDIEVNIAPFRESYKSVLQRHVPLIKDIIIEITGNMAPSDLNSVTGKIILESRIKERVNQELEAPVIKRIYFSRFVIQ